MRLLSMIVLSVCLTLTLSGCLGAYMAASYATSAVVAGNALNRENPIDQLALENNRAAMEEALGLAQKRHPDVFPVGMVVEDSTFQCIWDRFNPQYRSLRSENMSHRNALIKTSDQAAEYLRGGGCDWMERNLAL